MRCRAYQGSFSRNVARRFVLPGRLSYAGAVTSLFNPAPHIESVRFADGGTCFVIDDALVDAEGTLRLAAAQRDRMQTVDFNFYPGVFLPTDPHIANALGRFFTQHIRRRFDARRLLRMHCRLSMVTTAPRDLLPIQCLCHRDRPLLDAQHSIQACVLYLFKDESLGGTSFYEPARSAADTTRLFMDATTLPRQAFFAKYAMEPGYLGTNGWFKRVGGVSAKWNRIIFFDGYRLHSGDIPHPERLTDDPLSGRLTLNGFFTSRRNVV